MFGATVLGTQGKLCLFLTHVCVMGFQHDLVNYVLVFINLTHNVRARNWDKFRNMTISDGVNSNIGELQRLSQRSVVQT